MFKKQKHKQANKQKVLDQLTKDKATFLAKGGKVTQCEHGESKRTHKQLINPDQRKVN